MRRAASDLLGVLVLAIVVAIGVWVQARPRTAPGSSPPPDVTSQERSIERDGVRVTLGVTPRNPRALRPLHVRIRLESAAAPVALAAGRLSLGMTMPMGRYEFDLPAALRDHDVEVVLPACVSGGHRWRATVTGVANGQAIAAAFEFDLAPFAEKSS